MLVRCGLLSKLMENDHTDFVYTPPRTGHTTRKKPYTLFSPKHFCQTHRAMYDTARKSIQVSQYDLVSDYDEER